MAEIRTEQAWNHTASLLALIAETHRDPDRKRTPFSALDFHPMHRRRRRRREMTDEEAKLQLEAFAGKRFEQKPGLFEQLFGRK